jgi:hypothetical protein
VIKSGDVVICTDRLPASALIVGQKYTVEKVNGEIVWLDNEIVTFAERFRKYETPDVSELP